MQSYNLLVEKIAKLSGLTKEEIERRVEAKRAKLSGLISKEGAAQIVSAELNISFENENLKVSELIPGMKKTNITGKIISLFPVREYNKNGKSGKVANFILADETGSIRTVLWDTNHISLIETSHISIGDCIEIKNASMRDNELHLSGFSEIKKSSIILENVKTERNFSEKPISDITKNQSARIRGIIVQFFPPRFFTVCPECNKKLIQMTDGPMCKDHGKIIPKERALITLVIDDGTESIRVVLFSEQVAKIAKEEELKIPEKINEIRDRVLGTEFFISGTARKNPLYNNTELIASDIEEVNPDLLIEKLEKAN
jgi:ssDNA-binding replication factor A large subunit